MRTLHFTFGPIQDFIAQARRTRDLWAGSYLISYLAGHAMKALEALGGEIRFPATDSDPLMTALRGELEPDCKNPNQNSREYLAATTGSLPSRFKADVPDGVDLKVYDEAIRKKWNDIAQAVHELLTKPPRPNTDSVSLGLKIDLDIWSRQINHHWDYTWVISEDDSALDIRKNMRTHLVPPEDGEKCTICGERQEISGKGMGTGKSRDDMKDWWASFRKQLEQHKINGSTIFDLSENERLCAVCLVKRAFPFPAIAEQVIGWKVPINYPSTHYMAAVDWIIRVFKACPTNAILRKKVEEFAQIAKDVGVWPAEKATRISGITDAGLSSKIGNWEDFADLDGGVFFDTVIRNREEFPLLGDNPDKEVENPKRSMLIEALKILQDTLLPEEGLPCKATPFYALLLMDGDGMGKLISGYPTEQTKIANALSDFTAKVPKIVYEKNGRLIYAGGDDVFALLPLDKAIECAHLCRDAYMKAFRTHAKDIPKSETTISAAIEYAHMQTALGVVVRDAHHLLDEVAKDGCGRDGLACRVWKRGGPILTWAQPWKELLRVSDEYTGTIVDEVKRRFQNDTGDASQFSSKFFYKVRELFTLLGSDGATVLDDSQQISLLAAEYLDNRDLKWTDKPSNVEKLAKAKERVERLLTLCRDIKRKVDANGLESFDKGSIRADGALLVRFLSQKEV